MDFQATVDLMLGAAALGSAGLAYELGRRGRKRLAVPGPQLGSADAWHELPGVALSAIVLSASPADAASGDFVDAFKLDARFTMLLLADVSGKGARAAAQTAFIKYTIRTLALDGDGDPGVVLAKFNAIYERTIHDDEAFVVLILGVMDSHTGELRYASAGHEPAYVRRRDGRVRLLAPTGPIVGAAPLSSYGSDVVTLEAGDIMVWTTDGVTESRDPRRRLLGAEGLAEWVAAAPPDVALVADWILAALRRRSGAVAADDVAVLAIAYDPAAAPAKRRVTPARR